MNTNDGGTTWEIDSSTILNTPLTSVFFISPTQGFVVGGESTFLKYMQISGIEEELHNRLSFEIFPNPAGSVISCQPARILKGGGSAVVSSEPSLVEIYDLNGRKLLEKQIRKEQKLWK